SSCQKSCNDAVVECRRSECAGLRGGERRRCVDGCRTRSTCTAPGAAIRTLAYVVTQRVSDRSGPVEMSTFSQKLMVRRWNCDPIPVQELRGQTAPDPGVCGLFGAQRVGALSVLGAVLQRTGIFPDGSGVVFEVTDEFSDFPDLTATLPLSAS